MTYLSSTEARELAGAGLRVFPCRTLDKRPAINDWPNKATTTFDDAWFEGRNVGIRCGATDAGVPIFVVDIDIKNGAPGAESWATFCDDHPEVREAAERTVSVATPSGGWHFYFGVPEGWECPRNGNPWPGVDIRGEGGYVLAPPSTLENGAYEWVRDLWDPNEGILFAPPALLEALLAEPEPVRSEPAGMPRSVTPVSSRLDDDNPIDYACEHFNVYDWLIRNGWQAGKARGGEIQFTRPGKSPRDGTSATYHDDTNIVNIYTSTIDPIFETVGKRSARSGCYTINGWDAWMIENGYTNVAEAMSLYRREVLGRGEPELGITSMLPSSGSTTTMSEDGGGPSSGMNLPDEFWESRPVFSKLRQAAWARMMTPEAALGSLIARFSASIPPTIQIPAIVGSTSTFDMIVCIVGQSSGGKSTSNSFAEDVYPATHLGDKARLGVSLGSGEGIAQAFIGYDKEAKEYSYKYGKTQALHLVVDEGTALVEQQSRKGTTIVQTMCSAWSGQALGQLNATAELSRTVPAKKRRVSVTLNIQTKNAWRLFDDASIGIGLPGRMLFFWAHGKYPDPLPEWPADLHIPQPTGWGLLAPTMMEYHPEIEEAVRIERRAVGEGGLVLDDLDGHRMLLRLKLSGILALLDDRRSVTLEDWHLAGLILQAHIAVRNHIRSVQKQAAYEATVTRATAAGTFESILDDIKERQHVARIRDAIIRRVDEAGAEGITRNPLRKKVTSSATRHLFDAALQAAVDDGAIKEGQGKWYKV